jgi:polyisoprenoid-binding protein YceI
MNIRYTLAAVALLATALPSQAEDYVIDTQGAHAAIQFRIKHLGYSWLVGRFNDFNGHFAYDEKNPAMSAVDVTIKTASIDSNHAERDKHLRGKDFLDVAKFDTARFVSTGYTPRADGKADLKGNLTLHGVTRPVTIEVEPIGAGPDPWGGYRRGFAGTTTLTLKDYAIHYDLGPAARQVELFLAVEGIRK